MLHRVAKRFVDCLGRHKSIPETDKPIYIYGTEITLSTLSAMCSILVVSSLIENIFLGIVFLSIFVSLRLVCGGYHAKTYLRCFCITNSVFLLTYLFSKLLYELHSFILSFILLALSGFCIFLLSPIKNKNHPLSPIRFKKIRKFSRLLTLGEMLLILLLFLFSDNLWFFCLSSASVTAVAVMMIIPKIQERGI